MFALIIEDDAGTSELIKEILGECGYESLGVPSATEALAYLESHSTALILLDYALADMDGKEFIHALSSTSRRVPPFIVATGQGDERIAVDMMKLGARDYVVKDAFFLDKLPTIIKRVDKELENERKLEQMEDLLRRQATWSEFISDAVITTDLNLVITHWNHAATAIYGWSVDEALGQPLETLLSTEFINSSHVEAQLSLDQTGLWRGQLRQQTKSGQTVLIDSAVTFIKDTAGYITEAITINRDVTERQRADEQRLELILERERMNILANFITQASHEFRTPLSVINSNAYLLSKIDDPNKRKMKVLQIENQVESINTLIDMLTLMSQLDSNQIPLSMMNLDLNVILRRVVTPRQTAFASGQLEHRLEFFKDPLLVQADEASLERAMGCLVDNAISFTPAGGLVTLRLDCVNDRAVVEIVDTGIGIGEEDLSHIFERFYRADKSGSSRGFGLGLCIAKALIDLHKGSIKVESEPGKGSKFTILLPLAGNAQAGKRN